MLSPRNILKEKLRRGETVLGPFVIVASPLLVDTLGYSGFDFCIFDTEHGPLSIETATNLVIAAQGVGVAPIIRVGANDEWPILRALDIGAAGVQVPQVNTVDDAKSLVRAAKYAPMGQRGLSIFTRAGNYYKDAGDNHANRQNDETMVIGHIEGTEGLNNLDSILEIAGIDVFFLGPYDISQSLGIPGQVRSPAVERAIIEATHKVRGIGGAVGSYAKDVEMAKWLKDLGVQYISINVDATIYMQACASIVQQLR